MFDNLLFKHIGISKNHKKKHFLKPLPRKWNVTELKAQKTISVGMQFCGSIFSLPLEFYTF